MRAVRCRYEDLRTERPKLLLVENLRSGIESQHHSHFSTLVNQFFGQVVEGRNAHSASDQQRPAALRIRIEAVPQAGQQVELDARLHFTQPGRAFADDLIDQCQRPLVVVAHRNRTAQVEPFDLDIDELPGTGQVLRIPLERHPPDGGRQRFVGRNSIYAFFIHFSFPNYVLRFRLNFKGAGFAPTEAGHGKSILAGMGLSRTARRCERCPLNETRF